MQEPKMATRWQVAFAFWALLSTTIGETNLPPAFIEDMDNLPLSESTPLGEVVYTLKGRDPEGQPIKYGLVGTDRFSVNPDTGEITLVKPLDREVNDTMKFLVSIEDQVPGGQNNLVRVPFTIIVLDENDNAPYFKNSPYEVDVPEDAKRGTTVLRDISVEDKDSVGDNLEVGCIDTPQWADACKTFEVVTLVSSADQFKGALVLQRPLDYNEKQFYQFKLYASDGRQNSTAHVEVKVEDVQNSPPVFSGSMAAALSEDAPVGSLVTTIRARDADRAHPRTIHYDLITNPLDFFVLDSSTGELKTAKPLDREALADPFSPLNLTIRAREIVNGQPVTSESTMTTATLTVTIKDVNDEPPRFNQPEYSVEIPESLPVGTPIPNLDMMVTDTDLGLNAVFGLRLSDEWGAFVVEPTKAAGSAAVTLRLNNALDFEDPNRRKFILVVIAEELHTEPRLSSKAIVTVTVTDVNDNAPKFAEEVYSAVVSEDAVPGTRITTITATDRDQGRYGSDGIVYHLSGNGAELFRLDNRTGDVSVAPCPTPGQAPCLDIETRRDYLLHYKATDEDGAGQTTVVSLQVTLLDANDNPPACATAAYRAAIDEDATKFEPELQVHARDVDQTSEIRYSIVDPEDSAFWIDPFTGKVGVKMDTNVEMGSDYNNHIILTVLATDGVHNATCTVDIAIRDVNNHAPVFDAERYNATVLEDAPIGTEVAQVLASDMDSGINAEIKYSIQKGALDAFMVDNETGVVTVYSKLDYDKRNTYRINILASDKGMPSLTGTTELTVQVINVNDKLPYFTPQIQRAEVSADAEIDTVVHILIAMDPDVTNSEELMYELSSTKLVKAVDKNGNEVTDEGIFNNWFSVWPNGSVVVSRRPDRTRAAVLTLPVVVTDTSATTLQQADGELIITVVDVNRHAPIFPQSQYFERLPEEQPVGTVLGTYMATDKETPIAYYEIRPPNAYFHIDNVTGIIKSSQRIDYEKVRRVDFNVVAYDSGVPQLYGTANILVEILNINDEEPVFDNSSYEAKVLENSKEGTLVLTLHASDADEGQYGEVRYNLLGEYAPLFTIDSVSGDIRVARGANIDRETMSELWLQATATDNAPDDMRRMTRVMVHVVIEDVNDNSPVFTQNVYKSTIAENLRLEPPAVILQVLAEDKDIGVNGQIKYEIIEQSVPDTFTVDEMTGIIYPSKPVVGNTTYHLTVTATDQAGEGSGAHTDVAKVDIYVASVNKHKPVFVVPSTPQHILEIPENAAQADLLVLTVKATDEDTGENGRISYHLKVDNENVQETQEFTIDEQSGELRTKTFLDREHNPSYQLVVVAQDHGSPGQFEALVFLTVLVQDTNDNVPRFAKEVYNFAISENQPAGIIIGSLKAQDKDAGDNGKVYYHILGGNEDGAFILDRTQGFVRANISFDREKRSEYTMTVYASNDPIVERPLDILEAAQQRQDNATNLEYDHSIADVFVTVLDENDNEPKFQKKIYYAGVKNTARLNEPVITVTARDDDLDENGTLTYLVAASNLYKFGDRKSSGSIVPSPFNITQDGVVTTANFMSEYNQDRFILEVLAQEVAPPHRRAIAHVHVWIISGAQTLRMVLSRACSVAERARAELERRVSAATGAIVIAHALRQHVRDGRIHEHWCEVELHAVETGSQEALAAESALALVDARYDQLRDLYRDVGVETVVAAASPNRVREEFDPALATLIALLIVLFTGVVTFIVVCACLKHWVVSPPSMESSKGDSLARRRILDELSTTENPLWLENKLRPYEEQELTMNVFGEQSAENASENVEQPQVDNPYATIQGSGTTERCGEYATLGRGSPTPLEAALGFQGSTFKPPTPDTPEPPPRPSAGLALLP